ncbi:hypothetical protein HUN01_28635 [Nostoc edaphicum CCNP1411]|uniref:Uncharacterized protein n=1 Tax=Nostoc edaphicum CCNP1411 TaxID=1472755 RepID=A0A7D7LI52_9NOSO|nr:hypothetical protein [Nostoc edaphicum]QMS91372.1 hypothetical protein HUN01_28635 [Nostoc edaphicum CCNP1411]
MYKSQRLTLSYPAVERLKQVYNLPNDLPPQALAGYVERMIFEYLTTPQPTPVQITPTPQAQAPNINKLAAMATKKS